MGLHGHGPCNEVPSPDIYRVEDSPELMKVQKRLAEKGLKDPWLRNEVWRFTAFSGNSYVRTLIGATRGVFVGTIAFLATLGIEHTFGITYKPDHHDHNGHDTHV